MRASPFRCAAHSPPLPITIDPVHRRGTESGLASDDFHQTPLAVTDEHAVVIAANGNAPIGQHTGMVEIDRLHRARPEWKAPGCAGVWGIEPESILLRHGQKVFLVEGQQRAHPAFCKQLTARREPQHFILSKKQQSNVSLVDIQSVVDPVTPHEVITRHLSGRLMDVDTFANEVE